MSYALIIETDRKIYWSEDPIKVEWGFGSVEEAKDRIEELQAEDKEAGAEESFHIARIIER